MKIVSYAAAFLFAIALCASPAHALFTNGGFETGNDTGWTITGDHSVIASFSPQFNTTTWVSGIPYYGSYSLLLGSGDVGKVHNDNAHQSTATQIGAVTAADIAAGLHLYFGWGAILEEPTNGVFHSDSEQPFFSVKIFTDTGGGFTQIYSADHRANQPGFTKVGTNASGDAGDIWYGSGVADFDLSSYAVGDLVKVELFVKDCSLGGHGGLVFLDGFGTEKPPNPNVPIPPSALLLGSGLLGLVGWRRFRKG